MPPSDSRRPVSRALLSVSDKTGLVDFVHLPTGFVEGVVQRAPGAPPWTPPESRTLEAAENASEAPAPSRHPTGQPTDREHGKFQSRVSATKNLPLSLRQAIGFVVQPLAP